MKTAKDLQEGYHLETSNLPFYSNGSFTGRYTKWLVKKLLTNQPAVSEEDSAQIFYHNVVRDEDGEIDVGKSAEVVAKRINELQSLNVQGEEWISVEDRLPENADDVLCIRDVYMIVGYYSNEKWWSGGNTYQTIHHWMPLPPAPSLHLVVSPFHEFSQYL